MSCDPNALIAKAGCFNCFSQIQLKLFQIQILCTINGFCDPNSLQDKAKCLFNCSGRLQAMKVWILTQATGSSTDPNTLLAAANCVMSCLTEYEMDLAITILIAQESAPFPATPASVMAAYGCLNSCLQPGFTDAVLVYLYTLFAGVSSDVNFLSSQIACLECLSPAQLKAIEVYLWCLLEPDVGNSLLNGVYAYYTLNEATGNRADSTSNHFDLTDNGVLSVAGKLSNGIQGVPNNGNLSGPASGQFDFLNSPFTVTAWAREASLWCGCRALPANRPRQEQIVRRRAKPNRQRSPATGS